MAPISYSNIWNFIETSENYFSLYSGNHTVQILGTSVIPELQTIVTMILAFSVLPIVLLRSKFSQNEH